MAHAAAMLFWTRTVWVEGERQILTFSPLSDSLPVLFRSCEPFSVLVAGSSKNLPSLWTIQFNRIHLAINCLKKWVFTWFTFALVCCQLFCAMNYSSLLMFYVCYSVRRWHLLWTNYFSHWRTKTEIVSKRYNGFRKRHRKDKGLSRYYLSLNGCNKLVYKYTTGGGYYNSMHSIRGIPQQ